MRSRPTWTRYGNAIVMMQRATAQQRREGKKQSPLQATPYSPIFSDLPPEPAVEEGEGDLHGWPARFRGAGQRTRKWGRSPVFREV